MTSITKAKAAAPRDVHIIVTCTNRKSRPVPGHLRLADVPSPGTAKRCRDWISRLSQQSGDLALAASDLYAGEHWAIARNLPTLVQDHERAHLWACSAGYGLIRAQALIHPYAATVTPGHPDSVEEGAANWWQGLSEWAGPDRNQPRTIRALAETNPGAVFMLMLSTPYLFACRGDITAAVSRVSDQDQFILVSAGARESSGLSDIMMPADARLQSCLGGTLQALNARIGAHLLNAGIRGREEAAEYLSALLSSQQPRPRYDRKKLDDDEVMTFIADGLARSPGASAGRLLREFRDQGYACEQSRFGHLHKHLTEAVS